MFLVRFSAFAFHTPNEKRIKNTKTLDREKVGYDDGGGGGGGAIWMEEKPSKVQKIFQISVTALAFLAFGGYLLCMIVQAIKSKGTTYFHPASMPMMTIPGTGVGGTGIGTGGGTTGTGVGGTGIGTTGVSGGTALGQISQITIRKRRPVRIKRAREASHATVDDAEMQAGPSPQALYNALVMAAEGYVRLSGVQ